MCVTSKNQFTSKLKLWLLLAALHSRKHHYVVVKNQGLILKGAGFKRHAHDSCARTLTMSRCVVRQRQPNLDFCATRSSFVTTHWRSWCMLLCSVFTILARSRVYSMGHKEELDEKIIGWKSASRNSEKFPEFYLNVHQKPSHDTGVAAFI
jgi:hypothetical protein